MWSCGRQKQYDMHVSSTVRNTSPVMSFSRPSFSHQCNRAIRSLANRQTKPHAISLVLTRPDLNISARLWRCVIADAVVPTHYSRTNTLLLICPVRTLMMAAGQQFAGPNDPLGNRRCPKRIRKRFPTSRVASTGWCFLFVSNMQILCSNKVERMFVQNFIRKRINKGWGKSNFGFFMVFKANLSIQILNTS